MLNMCARKRVVVTIHGINTHGRWQKDVSTELARNGLVPIHVDYGVFSVLKFIFPWSREKQIDDVRAELRRLSLAEKGAPINIIAHSFGTFIAMEALVRERGELHYDRVVLTGSIVRRNFPWAEVFKNGWVRAVRNERTDGDWVVSLASWASSYMKFIRLNAGDSGRHEFEEKHKFLVDYDMTGEHSSAHNELKYDRWAKFLSYPCMSSILLGKMHKELQLLRQQVAGMIGADECNVRSNFFSIFGDVLHIVPGASVNMNHAPEFGMAIEPGHGGTGKAYTELNPLLLVKNSERWTHDLPADELKKVCPDLKWVMSLPVYNREKDRVYGVVNVDGLLEVPKGLIDDPEASLFAAQLLIEGRIVKILDCAFEGLEYNPAGQN